MLNQVTIAGNLGADPESRTATSGTTVCNLRVATNEREKKGDTWQDHTEWHRVVCFGKTADACTRYLSKGRQVLVVGKIRTNKWQDKEGNDRYTTEIIAHDVKFIGGKGDDGGSNNRQPQNSYSGSAAPQPNDDIPF